MAWAEDIGFCLGLIVESIITYDIIKLLFDSNESVVGAYKAVSKKLGIDIIESCLERVARSGSVDAAREEKAAKPSLELRQEMDLPLEHRNFTTKGGNGLAAGIAPLSSAVY